MTDEEKKAIELVKNITQDDLLNYWEGPEEPYNAIQMVLNLIEKKDKIINEMAKYIADIDITEIMCPRCKYRNKECTLEECIAETIKYFEKKVEGSNE